MKKGKARIDIDDKKLWKVKLNYCLDNTIYLLIYVTMTVAKILLLIVNLYYHIEMAGNIHFCHRKKEQNYILLHCIQNMDLQLKWKATMNNYFNYS